MKPQLLASCANCWHNCLQHGSVGLSVGYCTEHRVVLRLPEETTCAKHMRKDLLLESARSFNHIHRENYSIDDGVQKLANFTPALEDEYVTKNTNFLRQDRVGEAAANYGEYGTKIASIAQLRTINTFRSELAMLSLGRAYVNRCVQRNGRWTSGIHILWWTRTKIINEAIPDIFPNDLRYQTSNSLDRQVELAKWSLLLFRLAFISDVGSYAARNQDEVGILKDIAEKAAEDTQTPNLRKLERWTKTTGKEIFEKVLPESRYRAICEKFRDRDED